MFAQAVGQDGAVGLQEVDGVTDLVDLEGRVRQQGRVAYAQADDLDSVLAPQGVPNEHQLVDEGEDEEGEEGGDGFVLRV